MRAILLLLISACASHAKPTTSPALFLAAERACTKDDDCEHLGDFCHGGCSVTVNKAFSAAVAKRLATTEHCSMDCPPVDPPRCERNVCISPQRQ
jgi:hypothetical protein